MSASPASLPEIRAELAALEAAATPGPWVAHGAEIKWNDRGPFFTIAEVCTFEGPEADAEFIVAARNALPGLLVALADAEAARVGALDDAARLREALERIAESYPDVEYSKGGHVRRDIARAALSVRVSPAGVTLTPEQAERAVEDVARALYDRAMSERRTFNRDPAMFTGSWDDGTPDSRPSSWRDGWRDEARAALAGLRPGGATPEETA